MSKKKFLITTAIDYTNDVIHVGHSYQKVLSDCLARFHRITKGEDNVFFLTGTDEFGSTNEKAAIKRGITPLEHVTEISGQDRAQLDSLNLSYNRFIRTTDEDHQKIAQDFFTRSLNNGDIYKDTYQGLYCEGCEAYKTLTELTEAGQCPLHPTREIQKVEEENYFFKWSRYGNFLTELLNKEGFVIPDGKRKEMLAFVAQGLNDIPVTRPKYKVTWGIQAPNDPDHVLYVWFDALISYFTAGSETGFWDENTEIVHILGKDNARWHALLWPAMLKSAGYRLPDKIYVHGFINLNGEKISKSRGNVIRPTELVAQFGTDAVRYYLLKHGPIIEDVDISLDQLKEVYNADLANGLGNTAARISKMAEKSGFSFKIETPTLFDPEFIEQFASFRVDLALQYVWNRLAALDKSISDNQPWAISDQAKLKEVLTAEINDFRDIITYLKPFIPGTYEKLNSQFGKERVTFEGSLFPRL